MKTLSPPLPFPPVDLRRNHRRLRNDDKAFMASARTLARDLHKAVELDDGTRLLDTGCGAGRLVFGLLEEDIKIMNYQGLDVRRDAIEWCRREITSRYPHFRFEWLPVFNERYAPEGEPITDDFRLPFADAAFERIAAFSLLTHLELEDCRKYLAEFRRLVTDGGRVFITAFVEDGIADFSINPADFGREWKGPLHCVRFERLFFEEIIARSGFLIQSFEKRSWQSYYVLCPARDKTAVFSKSTGAS